MASCASEGHEPCRASSIAPEAAPLGVRSAIRASSSGNTERGTHIPAKNHRTKVRTVPTPVAMRGLVASALTRPPMDRNAPRDSTVTSANARTLPGGGLPRTVGIATIATATTRVTAPSEIITAPSSTAGETGVVRRRLSTPSVRYCARIVGMPWTVSRLAVNSTSTGR